MKVNFDEKEVNDRLSSYADKDVPVTDELYDFGKMLVSEFVDRVHHLDSKAATLAGYSTGIVALLVSTFSFWKPALHLWGVGIVFAAALSAVCSAGFSLWAASIFKFKWFSDDEWLSEDYLDDAESLRRYHILAMHNVIESHRDIARFKSRCIRWSQRALAVSAFLLMVALTDAVCKGTGVYPH